MSFSAKIILDISLKCCHHPFEVMAWYPFGLMETLADGSYLKVIGKIEKQQLLVLDDFGLQPLGNHNRQALLEIMEDRHNKQATIIASQLPTDKWHGVIGESAVADAILDRLVYSAHRIELSGESMRKRKNRGAFPFLKKLGNQEISFIFDSKSCQ